MKDLWNKISDTGIHDELAFSEKSRIRITNQMAFVVVVLVVLYVVYDYFFLDTQRTHEEQFSYGILHIGVLLQFFIVLIFNKNGFYKSARFLTILVYCGIILFNSFTLAKPFHSELYFFGLAAFVFVIFKDLKIIIPVFFIIVLSYLFTSIEIISNNQGLTAIDVGLMVRVVMSFSILFLILYFLQQENRTYQREVELKNAQVSADHDEIQKINFTKDKIFSIISHDLRSPIGSLQGLLGLLKQEQLSAEEFKKATGSLEKQVEQLKTSLDDLLTWSKAQLHGINPEPVEFLVKPLVYEVVTICRLSSRNKRIIITTSITNDLMVFCDPNMLRSVISNLVSNAIKFTPVGGAISVSCTAKEKMALIVVEDTGIGISQENLEKILSPTIHFTTRGTSNEKGTGLGLIMCKEFVQKNNGTLIIESGDGKGSKFSVGLPIVLGSRLT